MRSISSASAAVAAAMGLAVGSSLVALPPAAASDGPCTTADGTTVIVDATGLGGAISQRCADGSVQSGFDALVKAGFSWTPVSSSPALLCRIDQAPDSDGEDCGNAPPLNKYWAYFRADRGGPWRYSSTGAFTKPAAGGVEGWVFLTGVQRTPGIAPPAVIAASPTPTPTKTPTKNPTVPPTKAPSPAKTQRPQDVGSGSGESAGDAAVQPVDTAPGQPAGTAVGAADAGTTLGPPSAIKGAPDLSGVATEPPGAGSMLSTAVGVGTGLALLGGAGFMELRRRRGSKL